MLDTHQNTAPDFAQGAFFLPTCLVDTGWIDYTGSTRNRCLTILRRLITYESK